MALVRNITERRDIPNEQGAFAIIRKLTWKQLERAADKRSEAGMQNMKAMGGDVFKAVQEASQRKDEKKAVDPMLAYDTESVLRDGVANLSYVEKFSADDVCDLDADTADFLKREILTFSGVGKTDEQKAAEQKNG